jgi:hypothetical protein
VYNHSKINHYCIMFWPSSTTKKNETKTTILCDIRLGRLSTYDVRYRNSVITDAVIPRLRNPDRQGRWDAHLHDLCDHRRRLAVVSARHPPTSPGFNAWSPDSPLSPSPGNHSPITGNLSPFSAIAQRSNPPLHVQVLFQSRASRPRRRPQPRPPAPRAVLAPSLAHQLASP